jgi:hypothetical protein
MHHVAMDVSFLAQLPFTNSKVAISVTQQRAWQNMTFWKNRGLWLRQEQAMQ